MLPQPADSIYCGFPEFHAQAQFLDTALPQKGILINSTQQVNHCVFHYVSAYLVLSAIFLLLIGIGYNNQADNSWLVKFISMNYGFFALVQIVIAATSAIQNAIFKMFQWILFVFVAVFVWVGIA